MSFFVQIMTSRQLLSQAWCIFKVNCICRVHAGHKHLWWHFYCNIYIMFLHPLIIYISQVLHPTPPHAHTWGKMVCLIANKFLIYLKCILYLYIIIQISHFSQYHHASFNWNLVQNYCIPGRCNNETNRSITHPVLKYRKIILNFFT